MRAGRGDSSLERLWADAGTTLHRWRRGGARGKHYLRVRRIARNAPRTSTPSID
jgi:hypothetical protein